MPAYHLDFAQQSDLVSRIMLSRWDRKSALKAVKFCLVQQVMSYLFDDVHAAFPGGWEVKAEAEVEVCLEGALRGREGRDTVARATF